MKISKAWLLILPLFWTNVAGFHAQTFFGQTQESEGVAAGNFLKDAFNCGKSSMGLPQRRILNGKDTIEGDWPWVVFLNPGCTGSIITRRHVLTAAHCAYNITEDGEVFRLPKITAIAGVSTTTISAADRPTAETTNSNASGRQSLYIKNIFIHPAYDYHDFTTPDIAVLRTVRKICLPLAFQEDDGQIAFTVGWGADKRTDGYNKTETSEEALIPLNPAKRCVDQFRNLTRHVLEFNQENFICGGGTLRGTEIGDSGSPLMLNERGRWYQIGLTSFGEMGSNLRDRPTAETTNSNASGRQSLYIKIFIHPAYDYHDFTTPDIAVFEMAGEFRFSRTVRKICLPLAFREDDGQIAFTVGWGADKRTDGYNKTETSEEALIPLNPAKRCVDQFRNLTRHVLEFNQENFICGGGTLRGTEIGDSGSPLMLNERGRWYQIGLTSFGEMGSDLRGLFFDVGAYTRVAEFCPWISQMTNYEAKCLDMTKTASQQTG
uniref:Peptidase S1 domain-containing protein n=1 Tax=Ditylenchus dipsaci TaxID=166011 RepID=A0A915ECW9_9BILA